ncbi:MAG: pyruvate formate-lyase, partial [Chloroflexi bacterium]
EHYVTALADRHAFEYRAEAESAGFLYVSMLYDDCIARGKSLVDGGVRYRGGVIETFGMVNTADSLAAIKRLVYDQKRITLEQMAAVLDADFEGYERERRLILGAPKYGNDDEYVDRIAQAVSDHVSRFTYEQARRIGFQYFLIVNINNYANVSMGKHTAASADGRRNGAPLANGNTPTAGNDTCGVTAFLNSIAKLDPSAHAGYVHNIKFSKQVFREDRAKVSALLKAYFANGGTQAMITVVGRGDLEAALREPEKYRNLIVRVGGFSARFVELARDVQMDLIQRTLY